MCIKFEFSILLYFKIRHPKINKKSPPPKGGGLVQRSANMALSRPLAGRFLVMRLFRFLLIFPDAR